MVKGISRQVIVVHSPDPDLFEQAIFILKDGQRAVSEEQLLREANRLIRQPQRKRDANFLYMGIVWSLAGALATGMVWLVTAFV